MSQPTPFTPGADYSVDITPGDLGNALDADFADLQLTTDDIRASLALIQRDDGAPANATVHPDSLTTATLALIASTWTVRGAWLTATVYAVGDVVEQSSSSYVCAVEHISGTFATDDTAGKWVQLSDRTPLLYGAAGGTADVITANLPVTALTDGQSYYVAASAANATTTPTLNITALGAKTIVKQGNQALVVGDIFGAGHVLHLVYRSGINKFELLNTERTVTAFARTLLDDANAATALATLGLTATAAEVNVLGAVTAGTVAASKGVVVDANKDIASFRNLRATRHIRGEGAATSYNTVGNITYTAAEILTGTIVRDPNGAGRSDVLPTAALLVAAIPGAAVGDIIDCLIVNGADAAETITIGAGAGGAFDANQTASSRVIPQNASKVMKIRLTNVTGGAEAYAVYL